MRDNFYHWLVVALLFAVLFGAVVARVVDGKAHWPLAVWYGGIGALATAGAISSFQREGRDANKTEKKNG